MIGYFQGIFFPYGFIHRILRHSGRADPIFFFRIIRYPFNERLTFRMHQFVRGCWGTGYFGDPRWDTANDAFYGVIKTIPILPNDKSLADIQPSGLADDTVDNSTLSELMGKDQNGNPRITTSDGFSDSGAVEILWVRFNANGGNWTGLEANTYCCRRR